MRALSSTGLRRHAAQMHALAAVRREIRAQGAPGPRKYLQEFTRAFRKYDRALSATELDERTASADVVLIGDYHALPASQQFAADLIERVASKRRVVLGVEAILSRDQKVLDSWWRREISERELRSSLRFDREWGYPWSPFYQLLIAAREHAEAIYGLDSMPRHDMRRIRSRDRHAAQRITDIRGQHAGASVVVLFGESHMAPEHLPRCFKALLPQTRVLTILQNIDQLYWDALSENAVAVSVGDDAVCVFNSTPLEKYESYRLCLEQWHSDGTPDYAPAVHNLILSLARCLGFRVNSPRNGIQPKQLADSLPEVVNASDEDIISDLANMGLTSAHDLAALEERGCVYVPHTNTFVVREFRMAMVAAESARFLRFACAGLPSDPGTGKREAALAHFGARLLCPGNLDEGLKNPEGERLYHDYLEDRITRAAIRQLFLEDDRRLRQRQSN